MTRRRYTPLSTAVVALVLALAACTGAAAPSPSEDAAVAEEPAAASEAASDASDAAEPAGDGGGETAEVAMASFAFQPSELTVVVGTEVVFVNEDVAAHTVTEGTDGDAVDDPIVDENVEAGGEVRVTFDEAGTFDITCRLHPDMQMTITVEG